MSTVLITGASGGIGYELAKLFARDHHNLILVARSREKLAQVATELRALGAPVPTYALDLAAPSASKFLLEQVQSAGLIVDILVNNAGFGALGEFAEMPEEQIFGQIQLNIVALTELTRLFLPLMLARRSGRILNVASTAGFQPGPLMAVYYATKAYVISFTEAISNELKGSGINVICFCPGATATEFAKRADMEKSRLFKLGAMSSAAVARAAYAALLLHRRGMVIPGFMNKLLLQSLRVSPRWAVLAISRSLQE